MSRRTIDVIFFGQAKTNLWIRRKFEIAVTCCLLATVEEKGQEFVAMPVNVSLNDYVLVALEDDLFVINSGFTSSISKCKSF